MNTEMRLKILENAYTGALVDSVYYYGKLGILDKVTEYKKNIQMLTGKEQSERFGITKPEEVFKVLSEVFKCASWEIEHSDDGFEAKSITCKLCAFAKKIGCKSPCNIYCLNPMEGMIKGIDSKLNFETIETLWDGKECNVKVNRTE